MPVDVVDLYQFERDTFEWLDRAEFDRLVDESEWDQQPRMGTFGNGYGEPYRPNKPIFGILTGGRRVRTNTKNDKAAKT